MRLSQWRATAPAKEAASAKVAATVDPVLASLGADPDPHCWVAWGEEPASRFTIFVPSDPGLISCFVRVNVPGEGPRATTKLVRWNKVTIGELAVETQAGHRLLSFQLESQVLRGVDAEADGAAAFALRVIAAIDGRPLPPVEDVRGGKSSGASPAGRAAKGGKPTKGGSTATGGAPASRGPRRAAAPAPTRAAHASVTQAAGTSATRPKASSNVDH